ncbi:MAG: hypothetical protein ACD_4C00158G0002 [uncultured bacterium (gcode 4)]|uniref:Uncharacterized protein n=1 Tax=uncultured bacterium (gcode 4) TaxID=1234023 RepID=K2G9C3_9BACT|nr:MAG: hypothetical protein ACD_4C00158G0002 [uncultured bacterium (gcode 4)]
MFLWTFYKKYKEREYRIVLVKDLIKGLDIDDSQKQLYIESLEVLDEESLDRFYKKLTSVIDIIEEDINKQQFIKTKEIANLSKNQEQIDKIQEINSFNFLLDNI